ncbi:hypothetical protein FHS29_006029 [Saccharothrix tamanrassetensis]|uniref:Glycoside hydrolase family 42 N-terminal domain-containing protein n=1 Tax=Saccharothrix tamanrassetensis TaxID=1051531 RepID=A0A841CTD6_9PSEU|nr:hypothetical protein [Saccharothrix tamanrassetensis]MBB5959408.1 hypothetical protein [Saccharothrix tamanrassetensis]
MARARSILAVLLLTSACTAEATPPPVPQAVPPPPGPVVEYYEKWANGPNPTGDPKVFPINVWMQDPSSVENGGKIGKAYPEIGIDFGIGLWEDEWWYLRQEGLLETGWRVYADPKRVDAVLADTAHARNYVGYLIADEPDMNKVYGDVFHPDMQPSAILAKADRTRAKDPSRPTYLNFGVWMGTPGGGVGYGHIEKSYEEDMRTYCSAADIASADYYGWTHPDRGDRVGAFSYGEVIDTMRKWCGPDKPLYGFIETGHPHTHGETITPDQLESAVWNTILHGATGINYFAHSFYTEGKGEYSSVLTRPEITARVKAVNARLKSLAPVLNAANLPGVSAESGTDIPVSVLHKEAEGGKWVIAQTDGDTAHPRSGSARVEITVPVSSGTATVVDENRTVPIENGKIVDDFGPYQVHVYRF